MYSIFLEDFTSFEDWEKFQFYRENFEEFKRLAEDKLRSTLIIQFAYLKEWEFKAPLYAPDFSWSLKGFDHPEHFRISLSNSGHRFRIMAGNNPYLKFPLSPKLILDLKYRPLVISNQFGRVDALSTYEIAEFGNYSFLTKYMVESRNTCYIGLLTIEPKNLLTK